MAAYNKFNGWALYSMTSANCNSDAYKMVLTLTAPVATNNVLADLTQIANGNGYTTGGESVPNTSYTASSGTGTLIGDSITWTSASAGMANFRYVALYDDTVASPVADPLVAWWDYGSTLTLAVGETFQVKPGSAATGGTIFTMS